MSNAFGATSCKKRLCLSYQTVSSEILIKFSNDLQLFRNNNIVKIFR